MPLKTYFLRCSEYDNVNNLKNFSKISFLTGTIVLIKSHTHLPVTYIH